MSHIFIKKDQTIGYGSDEYNINYIHKNVISELLKAIIDDNNFEAVVILNIIKLPRTGFMWRLFGL